MFVFLPRLIRFELALMNLGLGLGFSKQNPESYAGDLFLQLINSSDISDSQLMFFCQESQAP